MEIMIKGLIDEDFVNYKKPSMFISFPRCSWKCEKECGKRVCQNGALANYPDFIIEANQIVDRYTTNDITTAIVIGGLEPFDTPKELVHLVKVFRQKTSDDIVIYTGYYPEEIQSEIYALSEYKNIIIKFGRFVPDKESRYDEILGVKLASDNQFAKTIS